MADSYLLLYHRNLVPMAGRCNVVLLDSVASCVSSSGGAIRTLTLLFLLWHPLSDVWWLPTNRHRLPTNRHGLHTNRHRLHANRHWLPTNRHRLHTNRHRLPTNRHRLPTNRHRLPTNRHRRAYWTLPVFFFHYGTPWSACSTHNDSLPPRRGHRSTVRSYGHDALRGFFCGVWIVSPLAQYIFHTGRAHCTRPRVLCI